MRSGASTPPPATRAASAAPATDGATPGEMPNMNPRKIDIYNHVMPRAVADLMLELAPSVSGMVKRVTSIPMLHDMAGRTRMMKTWPGYQQLLTLSNPPLEAIAGPSDSPHLA